MAKRGADASETPSGDSAESFSLIFSADRQVGQDDEFRTRKTKKSKKHDQDDLFYEQVEEQKQRRWFRWIMFVLFFILLIAQHALIAWFVYSMFKEGLISSIQPLLATIIPATLGETYAIINVMVKFIFSPGNFEHKIGQK